MLAPLRSHKRGLRARDLLRPLWVAGTAFQRESFPSSLRQKRVARSNRARLTIISLGESLGGGVEPAARIAGILSRDCVKECKS